MADENAHHFPKSRKKSGKTPESNKKRRRTQIKLIQQSRIYIGSHKKRLEFPEKVAWIGSTPEERVSNSEPNTNTNRQWHCQCQWYCSVDHAPNSSSTNLISILFIMIRVVEEIGALAVDYPTVPALALV